MDDLDLDAIRARAIAAGGADARWIQPNPVRASGLVENQNGDVIVYDEGAPSREEAAHIACMDPATTLALLDEIERLRAVNPLRGPALPRLAARKTILFCSAEPLDDSAPPDLPDSAKFLEISPVVYSETIETIHEGDICRITLPSVREDSPNVMTVHYNDGHLRYLIDSGRRFWFKIVVSERDTEARVALFTALVVRMRVDPDLTHLEALVGYVAPPS